MRTVTALCVLLVLGAGAGWAQAPSSASKKAAATKAQPKIPDAQLEAAIRARFAQSKISVNHFQVHVQGGVATIDGKTDVVQHKGTATRLAKTAGALAVNNRIQVSEAARKKASDNLEKGRRRAQIKRGEARSETSPPKK